MLFSVFYREGPMLVVDLLADRMTAEGTAVTSAGWHRGGPPCHLPASPQPQDCCQHRDLHTDLSWGFGVLCPRLGRGDAAQWRQLHTDPSVLKVLMPCLSLSCL